MHRTVWNPADEGVAGRWGTATASIDWCEANYALVSWCAELVNTSTNSAFVALAVFGLVKDYQNKLGKRFMVTHMGFSLLGIGSALFHSTLWHSWQLCDELPIIYATSCLTFVVFDLSPRGSPLRLGLPIGLVMFDFMFTLAYLRFPNPVFHQVAYATLLIATSARAVLVLRDKPHDSTSFKARNSEARRLQAYGSLSVVFAFFVWNLDNLLCTLSQPAKGALGIPWAWVLEGHAWWHIFTGLGAYHIISALCYMNVVRRDDPENYELRYACGFLPWVARTRKGFAALESATPTGTHNTTVPKVGRFFD